MTSRRRFLSTLAALPLGTWASSSAWPAILPERLLVLVYLKGGNDGFNTFIPLRDADYRALRPTLAIPSEQAIAFSDTHGFHAALKPLLPAWEAKQMALLQGIGQQDVTNQHYRDLEMQFTGASPDEYRAEGWISRALKGAPLSGANQLDAIAFGDLDIRVSDPMGPFRGESLAVVNMVHPSEWLQQHAIARTTHVATPRAKPAAANWSAPAVELKTAFPANEFGDALRAIAELAAARRAPAVVHVTLNAASGDHHDAFDTHWDQHKFHAHALSRLAEGLAAFRGAMIEIGRWNDTLVATYDEFGRSPRENERRGTHHGWASTHLALGGRVKGGLFGEAPALKHVFAISGPAPVIDTRELYTTIIEKWWNLSGAGVFDRRFRALDLLA